MNGRESREKLGTVRLGDGMRCLGDAEQFGEVTRLVSAGTRIVLSALAVLTALGCGSSADSSSGSAPTTRATSITAAPGTTETSAPMMGGEGCSESSPVIQPESFTFQGLDEESLRATPAEVRLPSEAGFPTDVVAVGDDVIVLEEVTDIDHTSGTGASQYSRADLMLRRVAADGSTRWALRLGTFVESYQTNQHGSLVIDGEALRVLWPRYDGELPAPLYTAVPATLVLSTVDTDGHLDSEVDLLSVPALDPAATPALLATAIGGAGSVSVIRVDGILLVIETFDHNGRLLWRDELESSASPLQLVTVLADDEVAAAWGSHLARWTADGARKWDLALDPSSLAPITPTPDSPGADLVVGMTDDGTWFCAIDTNGQLLLRTPEARRFWGSAERAWWTESGLMILSSFIALSANDNLIVLGRDGETQWDIQLAASGDVLPAPGSGIHDATLTDTGDILLAAAITGYPPGAEITYDNLETWKALIRLPAPAGSGDLSQLPISTG